MDNLTIKPLMITGAALVKSQAFEDERGSFRRAYCEKELSDLMKGKSIVNVNLSRTVGIGSVRGMHFQYPPSSEMKIVQCIKGKVWDVIVDVRQNSKTYLSWEAVELSTDKNNLIVIPEGVAHGFQTLAEDCELLYMHTAHYDKSNEGGLRYSDSVLDIRWPIPISNLSERDASHPLIDRATFQGVLL